MKCSALPTTSIAANLCHPELVEGQRQSKDSAVRALEAIVFRDILKPLTAGLGPLAEIAAEPIADRLAGVGKR
jgi:hypothetical protein